MYLLLNKISWDSKKSVNCTKQNLNWAKTFYQPSRKVANEGEDKVKKRTKGAVESMKNLDNKVAKNYDKV